ncbi:hypothetical protein GO003_018535 [Methylicorpusculum oleiharenae]|uniref:hypothetical protein n=1 Tax=Methylicorpusculum oleiharenae TaxID=1338687 RepID=UPI001357CCD4|nr:hypothetical protein [Methylicorpusculum oleiharenae]MCD2452389.1 hypothetical protein [Methylicorpusculum oleiharenae]
MNIILNTQSSVFSRTKIILRMVLLIELFVFSTINAYATHQPNLSPIPVIEFYPANPAKAFVLNLTFDSAAPVFYDSGFVSLKPAGGYPDSPGDVEVDVFNVYNANSKNFTLPSLLRVRVYNSDGTDSEELQSNAQGSINFSFDPDASHAAIADTFSNSDIVVDLKPVIHTFCVDKLEDPECFDSDLEMLSVAAVDQPPFVLLGKPIDLIIQSIIDNNGPETKPAPPEEEKGIDAHFNQQVAGISQGISISPSGVSDQQEVGLLVGSPRMNNQTYTITCLEPGLHKATFTSSIEPLSAAVIEPHESTNIESNNTKAFILEVDCAVPVTINNKPKSFPNSINTKQNGVIPVAVLTTEQGEYGNPIAFNAQAILPLTVHYGIESLASFDNGAIEAHGKMHIEDSYELDEKTKDKDLDAVFHFPVQGTGLVSGDTKTCIKGKFTDNGNTFTFFGCDSVNIVK